ncbi:TPA: hypothetical protein MW245_002119 [Acinetobacter baumannii]|nr:hypothetical protein [Acinetobacter baumannii]
MTDLNKEREAFEATESISKVIHKFEWCEELNSYKVKDCLEKGNVFEAIEAEKQLPFLNGAWYGWLLAKAYGAKAQAVPEGYVLVSKDKLHEWYCMANRSEELGCPECYEARGYAHNLACELNEASESGAEK